jgi:hypothetical protein
MSLEKKQGKYLITMMTLIIIGFTIMVYPFYYYEELAKVTENTDSILLTAVVLTKGFGVLLLFLASEIYHKHFKGI